MVLVARQLGERVRATSGQIYQQHAPFIGRHGRWFLVAWLAALVDGRLLLAIAVSVLTYRLVATGQRFAWENLEAIANRCYRQILQVSRQPLGAGILAFAVTYSMAAAWSELGGRWAGAALAGLGSMTVLLLARKASSTSNEGTEPPTIEYVADSGLESQWQNLTAQEPLRRLLAVRSLLRWSLGEEGTDAYLPGTTVTVRSHLVDCLRLMLTHETEPLVRVALVEGLKALQPKPQLPVGQPTLKPLMARLPQTEVQRSVEYVEP